MALRERHHDQVARYESEDQSRGSDGQDRESEGQDHFIEAEDRDSEDEKRGGYAKIGMELSRPAIHLGIRNLNGQQSRVPQVGSTPQTRRMAPSPTIPVEISVGETAELTNPDAATYYEWQGKSTSAQYYLSPINTSAAVGCQWGDLGSDRGNFAPINLGVGYQDGKTWLAIFSNKPTTSTPFEGRVEIQGDLSDKCEYQNGEYCKQAGCSSDGCTVSLLAGTATYVISSDYNSDT